MYSNKADVESFIALYEALGAEECGGESTHQSAPPMVDPMASSRLVIGKPLRELTDAQLQARLQEWAKGERHATAQVVAHLAELDRRKVWVLSRYRSLFDYCTRALGYSEAAALQRIRAARLCRHIPQALTALYSGRIHLSGICVLAAFLTPENADEWLARAEGKRGHSSDPDLDRFARGMRIGFGRTEAGLLARRSVRPEPRRARGQARQTGST